MMFCTSLVVGKLFAGEGENVWPQVRLYQGGFLLIEFFLLLGINTGWREPRLNIRAQPLQQPVPPTSF